jgi:phosphatidylserine decarboxylase
MIYVPGDLFSVNPTTARGVPGLFARNERVVCVFDSKQGPFVLTLVGATIVGSMATTWHGVVNPPQLGRFIDGAGVFTADDEIDGKPVKVKAVWDKITPKSCRWYQMMSRDGGRSWERGWYMDWTRVA